MRLIVLLFNVAELARACFLKSAISCQITSFVCDYRHAGQIRERCDREYSEARTLLLDQIPVRFTGLRWLRVYKCSAPRGKSIRAHYLLFEFAFSKNYFCYM